MTNGEKLKEIFPNIIKYGNILIDDTGALQKNILFDDTWWNAEYKEPTTKNNLGVDCISRTLVQSVISKSIEYKENPYQLYKRIESLPSVTPIRPKGYWIDTNNHHYYNDGDIETTELRCSCCNEEVEWDIELLHKPYYCENCGAKMESEVEE